jgi:hypothetical protein
MPSGFHLSAPEQRTIGQTPSGYLIAAMKKKGVACGTGDEIDEIRKRKK